MATFKDVTWTSSKSTGGTPNNMVISMPATVVAGDRLLMCVWEGAITAPAGWTTIGASNGSSARLRLYGKTAAGTEGGTTVTVVRRSSTSSVTIFAGVARFQFQYAPTTELFNGAGLFSSGVSPYTEAYNPGDITTAYQSIAYFTYAAENVDGTYSGAVGAVVAGDLEDWGSTVGPRNSTGADGATLKAKLILIGHDNTHIDHTAHTDTVTWTTSTSQILEYINYTYDRATTLEDPAVTPVERNAVEGLRARRHKVTLAELPYQVTSGMWKE